MTNVMLRTMMTRLMTTRRRRQEGGRQEKDDKKRTTRRGRQEEDDKKEDDKKKDDKFDVEGTREKGVASCQTYKSLRNKIRFRKTMLKIFVKLVGQRTQRITDKSASCVAGAEEKQGNFAGCTKRLQQMPDKGNVALHVARWTVTRLRQIRRRRHLRLLKRRGCCKDKQLILKARRDAADLSFKIIESKSNASKITESMEQRDVFPLRKN